ncbi:MULTISPECIES: DUF2269 family protein [Pontibacillus]|uniref:DUF2269 family protein n=1 Tax=Pontibacillus chungwhensis TaxID=265426 RepID=A0ABY8UVM0_9BACI|nr:MULTISPECIES: DUF2269 family protein [Pontibacillus]MCD5324216.1 DUF2269 domain-containing protein [Pontibacillus sp. HN14]WIF97727.1 DUF2269 family protein [Pontibacillus chungwhensis]
MTFYGIILVIHIIAAVCGLGATFALPALMGSPKTVAQAKFAHNVAEKVEKFAKIGSITLLLTGLALGALNTYLFTEIWFLASLVIYVLVQPIVAGIVPKKTARQVEILESSTDKELPEEYNNIGKALVPINMIAQVSAVVLIVLMTLKPF